MQVEFEDDRLDRLESDPSYTMGLADSLVKAYRKRLQLIRSSPDERDFYALKSLHYDKLEGKRQHQRSMRLNERVRLVLEVQGEGTSRRVRIVSIEDYH